MENGEREVRRRFRSPVTGHAHDWQRIPAIKSNVVLRCGVCGLAWPTKIYPNGAYRHGTATMYVNFGCRCPACRGAHGEYRRGKRRDNG